MRGTPELDFRQLFLVKESLALMYQMMQIPQESLIQYEELEALLSFASHASLPTNEWPLTPIDQGASSKKSKPKTTRESAAQEDLLLDSSSSLAVNSSETASESTNSPESNQPWMNAYHRGSSLLLYSINYTRMMVLKNRVSIFELTHYVFARQVFFLFSLGRLSLCADKGYKFITMMYSALIKRLDEVKRGSAIDHLKTAVIDRESRSDPPQVHHVHTKSTVGGALHATTLSPSTQHTGSNDPKDKLTDIGIMIGLWAVMATIQLVRGCREQFHASLTTPASQPATTGGDQSTSPVFLRSRTISGSSNSISAHSLSQTNVLEGSPSTAYATATGRPSLASSSAPAVSSAINDSTAVKIRDASRSISDLLFFAKDILLEIFQYQSHRQSIERQSDEIPHRPLSLYDEYRRLSLDIAKDFSGWESYENLIERYPNVFRRSPSQSDDDLLPSILSAENGKPKVTPEHVNGNGKQKLFRETVENLEEVRVRERD
jgi:hypothetical protein